MTFSIVEPGPEPAATILDLVCKTSLVSTRADGRRVIMSGGLYLNDVRVTDPNRELSTDDLLHGQWMVLRKGKRHYQIVTFWHEQ